MLAQKDWLSKADPNRGRFRAYLQTLLRRYTYRVLKRNAVQRRHPSANQRTLPLHDRDVETPIALVPRVDQTEQAELDEFSRS